MACVNNVYIIVLGYLGHRYWMLKKSCVLHSTSIHSQGDHKFMVYLQVFSYIWLIFSMNVGKKAIHGSYMPIWDYSILLFNHYWLSLSTVAGECLTGERTRSTRIRYETGYQSCCRCLYRVWEAQNITMGSFLLFWGGHWMSAQSKMTKIKLVTTTLAPRDWTFSNDIQQKYWTYHYIYECFRK